MDPSDPVGPPDGPPHEIAQASPPNVAFPPSSVRVLIVDDREANRFAFRTTLETLGFGLSVASSGHEAIAMAGRFKFAVVLLDVKMPVMDGIETATVLRRKPFTAKTPIIFVSAHQDTAAEVSKLSLDGPLGYVHSPVDPDHLQWKVKQYAGLYLNNERLRLRAEAVWQAEDEHLERVKLSGLGVPPEVRRSALRLAATLEDLREVISERRGISPD